MSTPPPARELRDEMLAAVERELQVVVAELEEDPQAEMGRMAHYHLGWEAAASNKQGKRIRPLLSLLVCSAAGGAWQQALPAAAAVELIHNFSLIHDDIEDGSETRRGRPTMWKKWDLPQALNTGDALLILSRIAAHRLRETGTEEATLLSVFQALDRACLQLTFGQHLDLAFESREQVTEDDYLTMIGGKTSALLVAAAAVGAHAAGAEEEAIRAYSEFAHHLGMAFQIQDDILGIWGEPELTGKPAGDDLLSCKKTLPVVFGLATDAPFRALWTQEPTGPEAVAAMRSGLETAGALDHARELAAHHTGRALARLNEAEPQGPAATELRNLSSELLGRDH